MNEWMGERVDGWMRKGGATWDQRERLLCKLDLSPRGRSGPTMNSHRLNQNVVLAVEQGGPGVLVQGLHIVTRGERGPVVHAATRMPLLDLAV